MKKRVVSQKEKELDVLKYMHSLADSQAVISGITTVSEWNARWLSDFCGGIKDSTRSSYEGYVRNHIDRVLGKIILPELTVEDVQLFINSLTMGLQLEKPLSPKSIKNIHGAIHKSLNVAVKLKLIPSNPADDIILPLIVKKPPVPLNDAKLDLFLEAIENHKKRPIFLLAIYTGLREAEVAGLTWDCFDFPNKTMTLYRQLSRNRHTKKYEFTSLKNKKTRVIVLPDIAYNVMIEYRKSIKDFQENDYVFKSKGALPVRKRVEDEPFSWTNDSELDKLLTLNSLINSGATLDSLKKEFQELDAKATAKHETLEKAERDLKTFYELKEKIEIVYEGKNSEVYTLEQAKATVQMYSNINASNYHNVDNLIASGIKEVQKASEEYEAVQSELKKHSDALSIAEKVQGGTYVQSLVGEERLRRESDYLPNGCFKAGMH